MYTQSSCWVVLFSLTLSTFVLPVASQNAVPPTTKDPKTFSNGAPFLGGEPVCNDAFSVPNVYGAREVDLPFNRLYHGNMKFFSPGQLNTPTGPTDVFGSQNDDAQQSACGIPDNAFFISKVAIHPYFLKYADLSRYCMQDVCISFWKEDGSSDMILKVTDICSTDPMDPTHCATPADIKIDRSKAKIMEKLNTDLSGDQYPEKVWWFFTKCWADALPQPAYQGNNWFTTPTLPCNLNWSQTTAQKQYDNNQKNYPSKGWSTYPNGAYNPKRDSTTSPEISDWNPGSEPAWSPIAGGKGWGIPKAGGGSSGGSISVANMSSSVSVPSVAASSAATTSSSKPPAGTPYTTTSSSTVAPGTTPLASLPSTTTTPAAPPANIGDANGDAGPPAGSPAPMVTTTITHYMTSSLSGINPYSCACSCQCFASLPGRSSTMPIVYPASSTAAAIASSSDANTGNPPAASTTPSFAVGMPGLSTSTPGPGPGPASGSSSPPYPANNATSTPNASDAPMATSFNPAPPPPYPVNNATSTPNASDAPMTTSLNPAPPPPPPPSSSASTSLAASDGSAPPPSPPTSTPMNSTPPTSTPSMSAAAPPPSSMPQSSAAAQAQSTKVDTCPPKKRKRNHRREHVQAGLRE